MKKLLMFVAFAGLVGSAYAITPGGDDKKKQETKKEKACCKKEGTAKACSGEKSAEAKKCSKGDATAKSCCKSKTETKTASAETAPVKETTAK